MTAIGIIFVLLAFVVVPLALVGLGLRRLGRESTEGEPEGSSVDDAR